MGVQELTENGIVKKRSDYEGEYFYESDTLRFVHHEEGRVTIKDTTATYEYVLKDHLGNTRITFTTKHETDEATATLESANASEEQGEFLRYDNARRIQSTLFDHTNGSSTGYAQRLNGSTNEKYGLAKSISVMPGDTVKLEVFAKYVDTDNNNLTQALSNFLASVANGTAPSGTVLDGAGYTTSTSSFPYGSLLDKSGSTGTAPKAYLNWVLFDRDYNFVDGGFQRMTTSAKEQGQDVSHERLSAEILITRPGYVYVYLSNEETTPLEVFFDDLTVEHVKSPVIQMDDYYPFGLTFNRYQRENSLPNDYQYNGKEIQNELNLGWLDYGARMYDPTIARWMVIDPMAEKYLSLTPYNYVANIPTVLIDPNGKEIDLSEITDRKERRAVRQALREHKSSGTYKNLYKELKKSDNRYVVRTENNENSHAGGSFEANTTTKTEIQSETGSTSTLEFQNPATAGSFKPDEKGGVLTINTAWVNMDSKNDIASVIVEEVVHAAQYENSVGKDKNATTAQGLPGTANTEFEAKAIVGQIQHESRRPLWTNSADKGANAFGVQAFQTKSVNGYFGALSQWHSGAYQERRETTAQPALLLRLIK